MKNKILFVTFAVAIGCTIGLNCIKIQSMENNDPIILANIEALSADENDGDRIPCHSSAVEDSRRRYTKCSGCEDITGWRGTGSESRCTVKNR